MPKKFIVRNDNVKKHLIEFIKNLSLEPVSEVLIKTFKEIRSIAQNALMWKWITIISNDVGLTKDELHMQFKENFCLPILIREKDDYPQFSEMIDSISAVRDAGLHEEADNLYKQVVRLVSTTILKTKHMTEYMNDISMYAHSLEIYLPRPEDQNVQEW